MRPLSGRFFFKCDVAGRQKISFADMAEAFANGFGVLNFQRSLSQIRLNNLPLRDNPGLFF